MKKNFKILLVTLLIICFTSTLFGCTNSNEVTDNNETTTTVTDNETKATKETEPTTEEPTTEEASTEYVFKGYKFDFNPKGFNLENDLTIKSGDIIYINEYVFNQDVEYDSVRGYYVSLLLTIMQSDNEDEIYSVLNEKYSKIGDANYYIPYADNYSFEYAGNNVVFKFIEFDSEGRAVYDVYKE